MTSDFPSRLRLDGRAFVVLGGGQGIGIETCQALAQCGARVLVVDLDIERAEQTAGDLGGDAMVADVTREEDVVKVFQRARELYGDTFDGVVDIVGKADLRPLSANSLNEWDRQFDIVLRHAFLTVKHGAAAMPECGGTMVFVSSLAGVRSFGNQGAYGVAKAALNHLVAVASHEFGPRGIRVNAVSPSLTLTPRVVAGFGERLIADIVAHTPLRKANEPADIASAILFLSSGLARTITGMVIQVDGGLQHVAALPPIEVGDRLIKMK